MGMSLFWVSKCRDEKEEGARQKGRQEEMGLSRVLDLLTLPFVALLTLMAMSGQLVVELFAVQLTIFHNMPL